VSNVNVNNVM